MVDYSQTIFPVLNLPNIIELSKAKTWDPKLYQPLVFNEEIKSKAEHLKPGTLDYDDFWDEMDYYCINGFEPKGMPRITGRHFYYLNMTMIERLKSKKSKRKTLEPPLYRDLDHWLFLELENAQKHGYGLIIGKPRRVGLSEFGAVNANYELTFYQLSKIGAAAGKDDKVKEFFEKVKSSLKNTRKEYQNGTLKQNEDEIVLGYTDQINKTKENCGLGSLMRVKTMYSDSGAFEGGSYNMVIFEEAGLFENLMMSFTATQPCFMDGNIQFGVPLVYGTGGDIEKGSSGYKYMWDNHFAYNLKKLFIPAYFYYPGDGGEDENGNVVTFFDPETGVTNREAAQEYIVQQRKIKERLDKDSYIKHLQSYPLIEEDIFIRTKGGKLDLLKLNYQLGRINKQEEFEPVQRGVLEWVDDPQTAMLLQRAKNIKERTKIRVTRGSKVIFKIPDNPDDAFMVKQGSPINHLVANSIGYKPDIGACDSYDEVVNINKNPSNYSSGAIIAYRCFSGPSREANYPVGLIVERGDGSFDDDLFYEHAVMFSIYWDLEVLIEHTKFHIERYFKDVGAVKYLKYKPNLKVTENHLNEYGLKMPGEVKALGERLLKAEVRDNIHNYFMQEVIIDLMKFGEENTDISMALMIALLYKLDLFEDITEDIEKAEAYFDQQGLNMGGRWYVDVNGELQFEMDEDYDGPDVFLPERDLDAADYEEYLMRKKEKESVRIEREKEYFNDPNKFLEQQINSFITDGFMFEND
jgi:hypothetical protein